MDNMTSYMAMLALPYLLVAHLCGDFLLQNHWMQAKSRDSFVCTVHVATYSIPFFFVCWFFEIGYIGGVLILAEHWLQDRFKLHLCWMRFYRQTTVNLWPVGPLCMDQAMHLTFIAIVTLLIGRVI